MRVSQAIAGLLIMILLGCSQEPSPEKTDSAVEAPPAQQPVEEKKPTPTPTVAEASPKSLPEEPTEKSPTETPQPIPQKTSPPEPEPISKKPAVPKKVIWPRGYEYLPENTAILVTINSAEIRDHSGSQKLLKQERLFDQFVGNPEVGGKQLPLLARWSEASWLGEVRSDFRSVENIADLKSPELDQAKRMLREINARRHTVRILEFLEPIPPETFQADPPGYERIASPAGDYLTNQSDAFCVVDPHTILKASAADLPWILKRDQAADFSKTQFTEAVDADFAAVARADMFRESVQAQALWYDEMFPGLADLPDQLERVSLFVDFTTVFWVFVLFEANTPDATVTLQSTYEKLAKLPVWMTLADEFLKKPYPEEISQKTDRLIQRTLITPQPKQQRFRLSIGIPGNGGDVLAEMLDYQTAQIAKSVAQGKLKQIALACHNYHDVFKQFPFPNGRNDAPLPQRDKLSWRVHLLPFLEEKELYERFRLDEPWDSEHNKALLPEMPDVFRLSDDTKTGHTQIVAPQGTGFVVEGTKARRIRDFIDGTVNSIMVLTTSPENAVPWTKPGGFSFDPDQAAKVLGGGKKDFFAVFAAGNVKSLPLTISPSELRSLLTIRGKDN